MTEFNNDQLTIVKNKALRKIQAYKELFLDNKGDLKPEAKYVLSDLYSYSNLFNHSTTDVNKLLIIEGSRATVSYILKQLKQENNELNRILSMQVKGN